jgi:hypothetical protein
MESIVKIGVKVKWKFGERRVKRPEKHVAVIGDHGYSGSYLERLYMGQLKLGRVSLKK